MSKGVFKAIGLSIVLCAFVGCTPAGKAYLKCQAENLPKTLRAVIAAASAILVSPEDWWNQLKKMENSIGADQMACVLRAVDVSLAKNEAIDIEQRNVAHVRAQRFMLQSKSSCRGAFTL